jgi:hypothetical protein
MHKNKFIVTTTINPPTEALTKFSEMEDWTLIVVGDLKTPEQGYRELDCIYLSPADQEKDYQQLSSLLGWRCIQRRNIGFLEAIKRGAELIATIDDDNIPLDNWGQTLNVGKEISAKEYQANDFGWFDPISVTNYSELWHRGFPIQYLSHRNFDNLGASSITPDIQADFWNGDPDVDAICRMEHSPDCNFEASSFPFHSKGMAPFNSQNTFLSREAVKEYFMIPGIGRMDDIWASLYLGAKGFKTLYSEASVRQDRNAHDLTVDFSGEIIGYEKTYLLGRALLDDPERLAEFIPERAWEAFNHYKAIASSLG